MVRTAHPTGRESHAPRPQQRFAAKAALIKQEITHCFINRNLICTKTCRSGPCPRNASRPWAAPTGSHKLIGAIAPQFAARQRGVWTTGDLLSNNPYIIDFTGHYVFCSSGGTPSSMPAKPIAGMARSYRYPQADRHDCLQFAARQRFVEDGGQSPTGNRSIWVPVAVERRVMFMRSRRVRRAHRPYPARAGNGSAAIQVRTAHPTQGRRGLKLTNWPLRPRCVRWPATPASCRRPACRGRCRSRRPVRR